MKPGSVLVDLAVERGGNVEGAQAGEVADVDGVKIVGYHQRRRAARGLGLEPLCARTCSTFLEILIDKKDKTLAVNWDDEIVKATALTRDGAVVHPNFQPKTRHRGEPPWTAYRARAVDPFVFRLSIFVLAVFVGYYVVWSVTPALHTPLMSVTNAISSVIVVGALLAVGVALVANDQGRSGRARSASSR